MTVKPEAFPSWIYHAKHPAYICMTEAEFDALPAGWADHPDRCSPDSAPKASAVQIPVPDAVANETDERAVLAAEYEARFGKAPHHAMKADTIRAKLAE